MFQRCTTSCHQIQIELLWKACASRIRVSGFNRVLPCTALLVRVETEVCSLETSARALSSDSKIAAGLESSTHEHWLAGPQVCSLPKCVE